MARIGEPRRGSARQGQEGGGVMPRRRDSEAQMPKGPKGEKRPADVIGAAVIVAKIATGEIEDQPSKAPNRAKGGKIGGKRRAAKLTDEQRKQIAIKAAQARWKQK